MKKLFATIVIAALFSCKKEIVPPKASDALQSSIASINSAEVIAESNVSRPTSGSYPVDFRVYNCTTNEWVHLSGTIRYTLKENFTGHFLYTANYLGVNGYGETSGVQYHGNGHEIEVLNINTATAGTFLQNFRFVATNGDQWIFYVLTHLTVDPNNRLVVILDKEVLTCAIPQ